MKNLKKVYGYEKNGNAKDARKAFIDIYRDYCLRVNDKENFIWIQVYKCEKNNDAVFTVNHCSFLNYDINVLRLTIFTHNVNKCKASSNSSIVG